MPSLRVTELADDVVRRRRLLSNPYLEHLADGSMPLEKFRLTQEQFFFAVTFFPRPMAALLGRITDPKARLDILHNLVEEHGEFREEAFHHNTFQDFLRSISSRPEQLDALALWPCVRAFNSVLTNACLMDELEVGVGCLGIIEYAFADISRAIGRAVVDRGWVPADRLVHYKLHAEIDRRHADEFFAVIEPRWDNARAQYHIRQGLELGAYVFDRLYRDLDEGHA
jgi:pyrroloquinoline-quinone synthase